MKKKIVISMLMLAMLSLTACNDEKEVAEPAETVAEAEAVPSEETAAEASSDASEEAEADVTEEQAPVDKSGNVIEPLPIQGDINNLEDGIYMIDVDAPTLSMEGFDCEVYETYYYDAVDISTMQVGDTFYAPDCFSNQVGEDGYLTIESIGESGSTITINGGYEEGGLDLYTCDEYGGVYRIMWVDDIATYADLGKISLPFAKDFVIINNADLYNPGINYTPQELIVFDAEVEKLYFRNTSIRIENGEVVEMTINFIP